MVNTTQCGPMVYMSDRNMRTISVRRLPLHRKNKKKAWQFLFLQKGTTALEVPWATGVNNASESHMAYIFNTNSLSVACDYYPHIIRIESLHLLLWKKGKFTLEGP